MYRPTSDDGLMPSILGSGLTSFGPEMKVPAALSKVA